MGGSERICLDLAERLSRRGHVPFLIHSIDGTMMTHYRNIVAEAFKMELRPFGWRSVPASAVRARRICQIVAKWDIDWLVCSSPKYVQLLSLVRRFSKVKVCFHLGLPGTSSSWWMKAAMKKMDCGIAPSGHTADTWISRGWPRSRMHVYWKRC